jgi:hypothetical protein
MIGKNLTNRYVSSWTALVGLAILFIGYNIGYKDFINIGFYTFLFGCVYRFFS